MRFDALDGLRGIVALAVVIYHYGDHLGLPWLPHAWVAVDTFFILSGFVLAHSYTRRVHAGMGFVDFARKRRSVPRRVAGGAASGFSH
jgi:peptidoglycan/LPS O-acetylase OafA/YrhL